MKISLTSILVFVLIVVFTAAMMPADNPAKITVFKGYLADTLCGTNGTAADNADMVNKPQDHTTACLKVDSCMASGYGIMIKGKDGKYSFVKFDTNGDNQVAKILKTTKKVNNFLIQVTGSMNNQMLIVTRIKEM